MELYKKSKKNLPGLKFNIPLGAHTTFKIGGPARYFFEAKSKKSLIEAVKWAKDNKLPFFVLGGGSNLLAADEGYRGLVIRIQNCSEGEHIPYRAGNSKVKIKAGAGARLEDLVSATIQKEATGLEWAAGIPGATVGGAIRGNSGAFGSAIGDIVKEVEVFDVGQLKIKSLKHKDCRFGYKETIFKKNKNLLILSCILELNKGSAKEIKKTIRRILNYRQKNHPMNFPSAGCVFKNEKLNLCSELRSREMKNEKLRSEIKNFPEFKRFKETGIIPCSFLIDKAGLKGKIIGEAQISEKHANFIVNLGKAKAKDVLALVKLIKAKVKEKFNVELEQEIQYLGN